MVCVKGGNFYLRCLFTIGLVPAFGDRLVHQMDGKGAAQAFGPKSVARGHLCASHKTSPEGDHLKILPVTNVL
jgi:hypothetical protein